MRKNMGAFCMMAVGIFGIGMGVGIIMSHKAKGACI